MGMSPKFSQSALPQMPRRERDGWVPGHGDPEAQRLASAAPLYRWEHRGQREAGAAAAESGGWALRY